MGEIKRCQCYIQWVFIVVLIMNSSYDDAATITIGSKIICIIHDVEIRYNQFSMINFMPNHSTIDHDDVDNDDDGNPV